jgi:nucleoside-diphosphate-sugar epimerase
MIKILLTGGCGFLGGFIVNELLLADCPLDAEKLRVLDLAGYQGPSDPRVEFVRGDVTDPETVKKACAGMDLVIHTAAVVDWGTHPPDEVLRVNAGGTANIIDACRQSGVKALVFTSSLDAVLGSGALVDVDETLPYPPDPPNTYCISKAEAEKLVAAANSNELRTVILRPAEIWGAGDPFHLGTLLKMARGGFYVKIGNGLGKSQHVYAGNMAWAAIQASMALLEGNRRTGGEAYFITDGDPSNFFEFYTGILKAAGIRIWPENFRIPYGIAYSMGAAAEFGAMLIRPVKKVNPGFSRFAVKYTSLDYTFGSDKAARDFGFKPKYSQEEAMRRTVEYYRKT